MYRPVTIVDAGEPKKLDLRVEVPVEDMSRLDKIEEVPSGPASQGPVRTSIWSAIHPKVAGIGSRASDHLNFCKQSAFGRAHQRRHQ